MGRQIRSGKDRDSRLAAEMLCGDVGDQECSKGQEREGRGEREERTGGGYFRRRWGVTFSPTASTVRVFVSRWKLQEVCVSPRDTREECAGGVVAGHPPSFSYGRTARA